MEVFMVFASQGQSPRDANTIKTAIQPYNCFKSRDLYTVRDCVCDLERD